MADGWHRQQPVAGQRWSVWSGFERLSGAPRSPRHTTIAPESRPTLIQHTAEPVAGMTPPVSLTTSGPPVVGLAASYVSHFSGEAQPAGRRQPGSVVRVCRQVVRLVTNWVVRLATDRPVAYLRPVCASQPPPRLLWLAESGGSRTQRAATPMDSFVLGPSETYSPPPRQPFPAVILRAAPMQQPHWGLVQFHCHRGRI